MEEENRVPQIGTIIFSKDLKILGINTVAKKVLKFHKEYFGKELLALHPQKSHVKINQIIHLLNHGQDNIPITMIINILGKVLLLNSTKIEMTSEDNIVYVTNFIDVSQKIGVTLNEKTGKIEIKKVPIFYGDTVIYLSQSDIIYIQSEENYCKIFTIKKNYFLRTTLKNLPLYFSGSKLFRVHKRFIVNTEHINKIEIQLNRQALAYFNDEKFPPVIIARRKVKELINLLKNNHSS